MMKRLKIFKNKYIFTLAVFFVYVLFLDDVDVVRIYQQEAKLSKLKDEKRELSKKFEEVKGILESLDNDDALERYARENKFFKKDDEDIFVIVQEEE
ncbi:MAG TPA: septum formation initiator family protein [Brumimicrobium sp.]|nr:septum formation initiator family protein [Brumimicrobium sp.]